MLDPYSSISKIMRTATFITKSTFTKHQSFKFNAVWPLKIFGKNIDEKISNPNLQVNQNIAVVRRTGK